MAEKDKTWRLKSFEVRFEQGYDILKTVDRYEGKITFQNGEHELFTFKIKPDMADKYIQLMSKDIVDHANNLGDKLIESLGINKL